MARTTALLRALLAVFLFLHLPLLLLRILGGLGVAQWEGNLQEDVRDQLFQDMRQFTLEAVSEVQVGRAVERVLARLPVTPETGVDAAWAASLSRELAREIPARPLDLWVISPTFQPLLLAHTPAPLRKWAPFLYVAMTNPWRYTGKHPEFAARLSRFPDMNPVWASRLASYVMSDQAPWSDNKPIDPSRLAAEFWSKGLDGEALRQQFAKPLPLSRPRLDQPPLVVPTRYGRTVVVGAHFCDPLDQRPLGGFLVTWPEGRLPPRWLAREAARNPSLPGVRRLVLNPRRPWERSRLQPLQDRLAWIDVVRNHPGTPIASTLDRSRAQHPARRFLPFLDLALGLVIVGSALLGLHLRQRRTDIPLRIYGKLNLGLIISGLLPLCGFVLVAAAYSSFYISLQRRLATQRLEERLQRVEDGFGQFIEATLTKYRTVRDRLSGTEWDWHRGLQILGQMDSRGEFSDYLIMFRDGSYTSSGDFDKDPMFGAARAIAGKTIRSLPGAQTVATGSALRSMVEDEFLQKMIDYQMPDMVTAYDRIFPLDFTKKENSNMYEDLIRDPQDPGRVRGVFLVFSLTSRFLRPYLREQVFTASDTLRDIGLDTLAVVENNWFRENVVPAWYQLDARETELFTLSRSLQRTVIQDDFDRTPSRFLGSHPLGRSTFTLVGSLDGAPLHRTRALTQAGIILLVAYAILLSLWVNRFLSRQFAEPLLALREAAETVARRDFTARVDIQSADEFGELGGVFNRMVQGLWEREAMTRFVSTDVLEVVGKQVDPGQEVSRTRVSVLFSDIRGFTTLSERISPEELVNVLNDYFTAMEACLTAHRGAIDKLVGDALMAVFRDQPGADHHAVRAGRAALAMREALLAFNRDRQERGLFPVYNGIGISTGEVVAGRVGSRTGRLDYTVIGDTVNIAARLEKESVRAASRIVISAATLVALAGRGRVRFLDRVLLKGKDQPFPLYELTRLVEPEPARKSAGPSRPT